MAGAPGEIPKALYGAYRLARLDPAGMVFFRSTPGAFLRSFQAALLIAPFYVLLLALRLNAGEITTPVFRFILVEGIAYVVAWLAYPVLMEPLSNLLERREKYLRYIVAYNWCAVLQNMLYLPLAMLSVTGVLPAGSAGFLGFIILMAIMGYTWFVAKTALDIPGNRAFGLVAIDFTLSLVINGYAEKLL